MEPTPANELEELVGAYHHLLEEHRRMGLESSARRHTEEHLAELEERFERLLRERVTDDHDRESWRERLHHGTAAPPPPELEPLVVFRGVSEAGSRVILRERARHEIAVEIDGQLAGRLEGEFDADVLDFAGQTFDERFEAPGEALRALLDWVDDPSGQPPREVAPELAADGLIDRHFGLTARGRRFARRRAA